MFPKRKPQKGEMDCPYDGIAYSNVPGYIGGYGCPVCGAISFYHLPVKKSAQQSVQRIGLLVRISEWFGAIAHR